MKLTLQLFALARAVVTSRLNGQCRKDFQELSIIFPRLPFHYNKNKRLIRRQMPEKI